MKSLIAVVVFIFITCSFAGAQSKGDTCANCTERSNNAQGPLRSQEERARDAAAHNEWPARPQVDPAVRPKYRMFTTSFLVNNDSAKEIREIKWTATLFNRETQQTIQTFPLQTKKKIGPHKSATLKERLGVSLTKITGGVVSATRPSKDPAKDVDVDARYDLVEIVYKDKSVAKP